MACESAVDNQLIKLVFISHVKVWGKILIFGVTNAKRYDRIFWKQRHRKNMEW